MPGKIDPDKLLLTKREMTDCPLDATRRRPPATRDLSHPIAVGQTVTVFVLKPDGHPFALGEAVIRATGKPPHCYFVQFRGERVLRTRFIHPDWHGDPKRWFELQHAFWQVGMSPAFEEFFPENSK